MCQLTNQNIISQAWQNQLLTEMGITRWVNQDTPVIEIDLANLASSLEPFLQPIGFDNQTADSHNDIFYIDKSDSDLTQSPIERDNVEKLDKNPENPLMADIEIVGEFNLQLVQFKQWVMLVDLAVLSKDNQQLKLWQNITKNLHLTLHDFNFPMVLTEAEYFIHEQVKHAMYSKSMALVSLEGFVYSFTNSTQHKMANLTALPKFFEEKTFQPLPTLEKMLADTSQKRVFWQSLLAD